MRVAKLLRGVAISLVLAVLAKRAYAEQVDCDGVGERVRAAVEENVERVLVVVEDAIVANEICVCEIVQGAILGSEGATDSVRAIVFTAVTTAPGMAATIAECAIAAAPDRAEEIRLALEAALVGDYENSIHDTAGKAVVDTSSSKSVQIAPVQNVQVTSSRGVSGPPSRQFSFFPIATRRSQQVGCDRRRGGRIHTGRESHHKAHNRDSRSHNLKSLPHPEERRVTRSGRRRNKREAALLKLSG